MSSSSQPDTGSDLQRSPRQSPPHDLPTPLAALAVIAALAGIGWLLVGAGGCAPAQDSGRPVPRRALQTSVLLHDDSRPPGAQTLLNVYVVNHSDEDITLDFMTEHQFGYEVRTIDDAEVVLTDPWHVSPDEAQPSRLTIAAGDTVSQEFMLHTRRTDGSWRLDDDVLPVGEYRVRAGLQEHGEKFPWAETVLHVGPGL
ncbi:MAG: hypothetical protein R6X25_13920 [Candidatus Krumholzibacteriia bacterium]